MGLDIRVHVGAYVVIKAEPVVTEEEKHVCVNGCKGAHPGNYCSNCGAKVNLSIIRHQHAASLYDLLPEDKYCDELSWAAREDNLDVILAIDNRINDGTSVGDIDAEGGATINEITPNMPTRFIEAFNVEYADVLEVLRERATSVEVKFGVLTWWS